MVSAPPLPPTAEPKGFGPGACCRLLGRAGASCPSDPRAIQKALRDPKGFQQEVPAGGPSRRRQEVLRGPRSPAGPGRHRRLPRCPKSCYLHGFGPLKCPVDRYLHGFGGDSVRASGAWHRRGRRLAGGRPHGASEDGARPPRPRCKAKNASSMPSAQGTFKPV